MERLLYVGKPSEQDLAAVAGEPLPAVVEGQPKSAADRATWHG